jgi:hypothetical protein
MTHDGRITAALRGDLKKSVRRVSVARGRDFDVKRVAA